mmetsp:Transcript_64495/g.107183  ORF Transcript_64495/g.107183 Transcript_64495/m.107183 type:complete len:141 (-) Transcript_64495:149-571(-)|eukprot:CAMPEP_0119346824 /NCGR_PEP_ID=MMETSP1333-20130426/108203_1 /TAXON_ID=418940 /ORGANISM="Scyphosphaera apsteinii, Strain RCC1455" /LENGTH=140 /DNA_ID=CAMNT_0007359345 /DNA_START=91 /DNA_END=513 /DNA_ORIENTATION=-
MKCVVCALLMLYMDHQNALELSAVTRRQTLKFGVTTLLTPCGPAFAKSKASLNPNKPEGVGAASGSEYRKKKAREEYAAMAGDKGSRGSVIDENFGSLESGRRASSKGVSGNVNADRNRSPAELGLLTYEQKMALAASKQ